MAGTWIVRTRRLAIYLRDRFTCLYCGKDLHGCSNRDITLDHVRCRIRGGCNRTSNLITACVSCNSRRAHRPIVVVFDFQAYRRIRKHVRRSIRPYLRLSRALLGNFEKSRQTAKEIP